VDHSIPVADCVFEWAVAHLYYMRAEVGADPPFAKQ